MAISPAHSAPRCSVQVLLPLVATLHRDGLDVEAILARAEIEVGQLEDPDKRVSAARIARAWEAAIEASGDPALGLRVVEFTTADSHGRLAHHFTYLAAASGSARDAFSRAATFAKLANENLRLSLREEAGRAIFAVDVLGMPPSIRRTHAEFIVGMMCKLAVTVIGTDRGVELWFAHPEPEYGLEYARVYGCPIRFERPHDALVWPASVLDQPLPGADPALRSVLEQSAAALVEARPPRASAAQTAREQLKALLPTGRFGLGDLSQELGTSSATLRRRLLDAGSSYRELLDAVRKERALVLLEDADASTTEIALVLGFSDGPAFTRAFRRWFGRTPRDHRRRIS